MTWLRRALVLLGGGAMAYAVVGVLTDRDARPVGHVLFLAGVLVAHDAVLMPAAIGVGVLIGRFVPRGIRVTARVAAFVTATVLVIAVPLALGMGKRPDTPSALPLHYGRGLVVTLLLVWTVALAAALVHRDVRLGCQDVRMAFDEDLADRVRALVAQEPGFAEKRMFGGVAMMLAGNMAVVVRGKGGLMVRVDPAESDQLRNEPGVEATVMRGRPMRGWLTIDPAACATDAALRRWVEHATTFTRTLPPK